MYQMVKMTYRYGYSVLDYESTPIFPGNLRGLKFREFLWTLCGALGGLGNGWWHTSLYRSEKETKNQSRE